MNTTTIYSATTPRISGFWSTTPPQYIKVFSVLIRTTLSISIIFCVLSLVIFIGGKTYKALATKNIISLIVSLLVFEIIVFCELCNWNLDYVACYTAAMTSQWAQLSINTWLNVLAIDIWRASSVMECHGALRENCQTKWFLYYAFYGWGLSAVFVGISVVIDHLDSIPVQYKPHYVDDDHRKCWSISWNYVLANIIYSAAPCMLLVIVGLVFLVLTYVNIRKTKNLVPKTFCRRTRKRFILYVNMTSFRDIMYIIGFIPLWNTWYIVVTLTSFAINCLLGFHLFVLFVFNKKKVKATMLQWIRSDKSNNVDGNDRF